MAQPAASAGVGLSPSLTDRCRTSPEDAAHRRFSPSHLSSSHSAGIAPAQYSTEADMAFRAFAHRARGLLTAAALAFGAIGIAPGMVQAAPLAPAVALAEPAQAGIVPVQYGWGGHHHHHRRHHGWGGHHRHGWGGHRGHGWGGHGHHGWRPRHHGWGHHHHHGHRHGGHYRF